MVLNYCDCSGMMATCKKGDNPLAQAVCTFSKPASILNKTKDRYCIHLGKVVENHCDSAAAQWDAKHGKPGKEVIPLSEEEVFDVRKPDTYPIYGITY